MRRCLCAPGIARRILVRAGLRERSLLFNAPSARRVKCCARSFGPSRARVDMRYYAAKQAALWLGRATTNLADTQTQ